MSFVQTAPMGGRRVQVAGSPPAVLLSRDQLLQRIAGAGGPLSSTSGYRPPGVPVGPLPGSDELIALLAASSSPTRVAPPAAGAMTAAFNAGTPAPSSLFTTWPWTTVGKVYVGHRDAAGNKVKAPRTVTVGSGVLVSRLVLLTASHVAPWEFVSTNNWWMEFYPAYYRRPSMALGEFADVVGWYGTVDDPSEEGDKFGRDYVVCALDKPLGSQCGWVGVTSLKEERYDNFTYTSIGYPVDVEGGEVPCVEYGLTIRDIDNGGEGGKQLETRRYGGGGWSGGPLWANIDGGLLVAAVVSGSQKDFLDPTRTVHSGGGRMVDLVRYGYAEWEKDNFISLWTVDAQGELLGYKEHGPFNDWTPLNYADGKILWRYTDNRISLWTMDAQGELLGYKEHGPFDGWTPLNYADGKILWRYTDNRISLWTMDAQGELLGYKEHGPFDGWTPLNYADRKILWRGY